MDALMVFGPGSFEINCFTNDNLISQPNCKGKVLAAAPAGIANIAAKGPPTGPAPTAPALPPAQVQNIVSNLGTALNSTGLLVNTTQLSSTLTASSVSLSSSGSTPLTGGSIASSNTGANTVIVNIVTPLLIFSDATTSDTYGALTSSNISSTTTSDGVNFHYLLPSSIGSVWYVFQTSTPGQITIIVNSAKTALGSITFPTQAASHRRDLSATSSSITVQQAYAPYKVRNTVSSQYHKAIANPNAGHPSVPKPQNKGSKPGKKPTATGKGKTGKGKTTGTPQDCSKFKKGNKITNKKAYQACLAYNKKLKGKTTATTKGKTSTGKHAPAVSTKGAKKPKYTTYKKTPKKASTKTKVSPKKTTTYTTVTKSAKKSPKKPKAPKKNSPASHAR
ncbi:hypothetical protein BC830DRAFT_1169220 [Chytriomyces sp. MP71]|nr:hypothetical protein BC830DRAFT_1169220 [Chytriomyces sp. MP71]